MALYRVWGAVGALLGLNIAVRLFNIPVEGNFILGNHMGEAIMLIGIIGLLADLKLFPAKYRDNLLALGIIALITGTIWEVLSFGSLFIKSNSTQIIREWIKVAPLMIFAIGLPCLYISKRVSREKLIFGIDSTNAKGLIFNVSFCIIYTIIAIFLLNNWNLI